MAFAATRLTIGTNYDAASLPNQNDECDVGMTPPTGNLIFGAINDDDPEQRDLQRRIAPSCVAGTVMFDATGQRRRQPGADNAWGISFYNTPPRPRAANQPRDHRPPRQRAKMAALRAPQHHRQLAAAGRARSKRQLAARPRRLYESDRLRLRSATRRPDNCKSTFCADTNPMGGTDDGFRAGRSLAVSARM